MFCYVYFVYCYFFFFQAEDGIRDKLVTGVQTCALRSSRSSWRSCWISIFSEIAGIARWSSEKRSTLPPNRWKRITSFQRPSKNLNACSTPLAAVIGVCFLSLLEGEYLTFLYVLAIL